MDHILSKEKKCVSITAKHIIPKEKPSLGRNAIKILLKDVLADEPIFLMPIILVIYIVCLPVTIFEVFKGYRDEKNTYKKLVAKFYHFNGFHGEKKIASLWHEYGVDPKKFILNEKELANCLSSWISILYEKQYHISTREILQRFKIQQKQQAEAYARAYENSGAMISFVDARVVVVDDILGSLPNYAHTSATSNQYTNTTKEYIDSNKINHHDYKELLPFFQEAFKILTDFCIEQADNNNISDSVEIGTSASAIVAASYFINTVTLQKNNNINREHLAEDVIEVSNMFFDYISGSLAKVAEREMGKKINLEEWLYPVTEIQQNKVGKYIPAIITSLKKISSGGGGFDITVAVTEDLFGEEVPDLIFHTKLISFIPNVKL